MKLIVKVLLTFLKLKVDEKINFGKGVIAGITANVGKFPNLPITLIALQAVNDALATAVFNALTGSKTSKKNLATSEKNWNIAFKSTANYVGTVANGDESIIIEAGFVPSKSDSTPGIIPALFLLFTLVSTMVKGVFGASVAAIKGVKNLTYVFIASSDDATITQADDTLIITVGTVITYVKIGTKRAVSFANMPASKLNVTTFGVNGAGMGPMNASLAITPQ